MIQLGREFRKRILRRHSRAKFIKKHWDLIREVVISPVELLECEKLLVDLARMELHYSKNVEKEFILDQIIDHYLKLKGKS